MRPHCTILAGVALALFATLAFADKVQELLSKAHAAAGAAAVDAIHTTHAQYTIATGGLQGTAESVEDNLTGHFHDSVVLGPIKEGNGFDGSKAWSQDDSGQSRVEDTDEGRQAAANEAYRRSYSYWTHRKRGEISYVGQEQDQDRTFEVLRITPQGGRPFDVWLDPQTSLFDRTVEKGGTQTVTTYYSDYREISGVHVAHAIRTSTGDPKYDVHLTLTGATYNEPVQAAEFALPAPPPRDFAIKGDAAATTVPFDLINNHIYIDVRLNGRGPYRMLCDTGGANIVTPQLARELGLQAQGALQGQGVGEKSQDVGLTRVNKLEVGDVAVNEQTFYIFALDDLIRVEGVPASGVVGYELFKRFVVNVDYQDSRLTFNDPDKYTYKGAGTALPFKFKEHVPEVDGEVDGVPGKFDIDTGSRGSLDLLGPFIEKNGLRAKYQPRIEAVTGWGVGGPARAAVTRATVLKLGDNVIERPITELTLQTKGAFTDQYVAGNVGAGVLKRFNLVFDYGKQVIYFERNANYGKPDIYDRAGLWLNSGDGFLEVVDVVPGAPAAQAGLEVGDHIRSVDGKAAADLKLPELRARFRGEPGTRIAIAYERAGKPNKTTLVLKELVP